MCNVDGQCECVYPIPTKLLAGVQDRFKTEKYIISQQILFMQLEKKMKQNWVQKKERENIHRVKVHTGTECNRESI